MAMLSRPQNGFAAIAVSIGLLAALAGGQSKDGATSGAPAPDAAAVREAIERGVALLLRNQERYVADRGVGRLADDALAEWQERERKRLAKAREGKSGVEWPYEGVYRVRGRIPPGYRVGGTAIVCSALVLAPGFDAAKDRQRAVARAAEFMLHELDNDPMLDAGPKVGYDVRGWAHTYALDFFLLALRRKLLDESSSSQTTLGKTREKMRAAIPHLIACIAANEIRSDGGWNYANNQCSPFMTGSTLLALFQARAQGFTVEDAMVERALGALERARADDGAFVYAGALRGGRSGRTAMPGACARASIAELCLFLAGRSDAKRVRVAVDAFFEHWGELLKRKSQQGTHVGPYGIAPYYFFYGHTYAALAIECLPEEERPALRDSMRQTLFKTREESGAWNDRIFPRSESYSTAMAVLALLAPEIDRPPEWKSASDDGKRKSKERGRDG